MGLEGGGRVCTIQSLEDSTHGLQSDSGGCTAACRVVAEIVALRACRVAAEVVPLRTCRMVAKAVAIRAHSVVGAGVQLGAWHVVGAQGRL